MALGSPPEEGLIVDRKAGATIKTGLPADYCKFLSTEGTGQKTHVSFK
jgi:hypothetical protein